MTPVCVAPLAGVSPLNLTLIATFLFTRHGERTPYDNWALPNETGTWICDNSTGAAPRMHSTNIEGANRRFHQIYDAHLLPLNGSCANADLTVNGMAQHTELGHFYREKLVDGLHFLPEHFDPSLISLRSSESERSVRSLIAFINGMYPPTFMHELINIQTGTPTFERLSPASPSGCAEFTRDFEEFEKSAEFQQRANISKLVLQPLFEYLNLSSDGDNWLWMGDWAYSFLCGNQSLPSVVTEEMVNLLMDDATFAIAGVFRQFPLSGVGPIWRLLLGSIDSILSGYTQTKFHLFSGHDASIAAILEAIGHHVTGEIPPYRSHLLVELYDHARPVLRFVYNGVVIDVNGSEVVSLRKFKMAVLPSLSHCLETGFGV
jgi:acid phosphatase